MGSIKDASGEDSQINRGGNAVDGGGGDRPFGSPRASLRAGAAHDVSGCDHPGVFSFCVFFKLRGKVHRVADHCVLKPVPMTYFAVEDVASRTGDAGVKRSLPQGLPVHPPAIDFRNRR